MDVRHGLERPTIKAILIASFTLESVLFIDLLK